MQTDKMRGKEDEIHQFNGCIKSDTDIVTRGIIGVEFMGNATSLSCVTLIIVNYESGKEDPET